MPIEAGEAVDRKLLNRLKIRRGKVTRGGGRPILCDRRPRMVTHPKQHRHLLLRSDLVHLRLEISARLLSRPFYLHMRGDPQPDAMPREANNKWPLIEGLGAVPLLPVLTDPDFNSAIFIFTVSCEQGATMHYLKRQHPAVTIRPR